MDRAAAQEMVDISHQMGVPVTVIDGQVVVGFNRQRLEQLIVSAGQPIHFGIKAADADKIANQLNVANISGAYIGTVKTSSLAEQAGLRTGDIVTGLNSTTISGTDSLQKTIAHLKKGSHLKITYLRDGYKKQTQVII
jgi:putative serine protease PepD